LRIRAPRPCLDVNRRAFVSRRADYLQTKRFSFGEFLESAAQRVEMLDRAVTSGPANHGWSGFFGARQHAIFFSVDGGWDYSDAVVHLPRVLREIRITDHYVRSDTTDSFSFRGKLQVAQVAV